MGVHQFTSYFYGVPLDISHPFISTTVPNCKHDSFLMKNDCCSICGVVEGTHLKIKLTSLMIAKREFKSFCKSFEAEDNEYFFGCYIAIKETPQEGIQKADMLTIDEMVQIHKKYKELGLNTDELGLYSFTSFG